MFKIWVQSPAWKKGGRRGEEKEEMGNEKERGYKNASQ